MNPTSATILKENLDFLSADDKKFAGSLLTQLEKRGDLSDRQWPWVEKLATRAEAAKSGVPDFTESIEVGDFGGVIALFDKASKNLKHPHIRLQLPSGAQLSLNVAGKSSSRPGCVNLTDGKPFGRNTWYGRVNPDGRWEPSRSISDDVGVSLMVLLTKLASDPAGVAAEHGRLTGRCCFCGGGLTDERSTALGYGPQCAKNFGLAWGKQ